MFPCEKYLFWKSAFVEKVSILKKLLLYRSPCLKSSSFVDIFTSSFTKKVAVPTMQLFKEPAILKNWLLGRSFTLKK